VTLAVRRLDGAFVHLGDGGGASAHPVGPDFWANMPAVFDTGRMVSAMAQDRDWTAWEMHPEGDELIVLLSGRLRLLTEAGDAELGPGDYVLMPRGVWHTADVLAPGEALFVMPGAGTQSRPR
jgi:homogentisate 1,2-dioxygenase